MCCHLLFNSRLNRGLEREQQQQQLQQQQPQQQQHNIVYFSKLIHNCLVASVRYQGNHVACSGFETNDKRIRGLPFEVRNAKRLRLWGRWWRGSG
eukprot:1683363-Amphidinium_carterae.1